MTMNSVGVAALLKEKAAEGVAVYVLYDGIGSHALPHSYVHRCATPGAGQGIRHPQRLAQSLPGQLRNHRKIVVVDGVTGFVGGHNVGDEYWAKTAAGALARYPCAGHGPVVACLQESFAEDWFWAARELPPLILPDTYPKTACSASCWPAARPIHTKPARCSSSKPFTRRPSGCGSPARISFPTKPCSPPAPGGAARGGRAPLLPSRPDHRIVYAASSLYAFEAVRAGVRVFRYQPGFLHQKVVLVDNEISAIGSANLDNRSFRLNFEVMLLTVDAPSPPGGTHAAGRLRPGP
jgi:cardiolipin synthase